MAAALKLFSSQGYAETSIRTIAKEADISLGLMYNYFKSKEELLLAILQGVFHELDTVFKDEAPQTPKEQFKASIERFIRMLERNHEKLRMLAQLGLHQKKFDLANDLTRKKYEQSVSRFTENLVGLGFSTEQAGKEARLIVAILDGLTFEYLLMNTQIPLLEVKEHLISSYCNN